MAASTGDTGAALIGYRDQNGISDRVVFAIAPQIRRDYSVARQSSKVAIGSDGVIIERRGYGGGTSWHGILDRLLET